MRFVHTASPGPSLSGVHHCTVCNMSATESSAAVTVLIVPGAWHHGIHYQLLREGLQKISQRRSLKLNVTAIDLPTASYENPAQYGTHDDIVYIRQLLEQAADAGSDIIIIAHSYGGIPASQAMEGLDRASRRRNGKAGGVVHMVFMAAFLIPARSSLAALYSQDSTVHPQLLTAFSDSTCFPNDPIRMFYTDLDQEAQLFYRSKLSPSSIAIRDGPSPTYSGFCHAPVTYLMTMKDEAIPVRIQQLMVQNAKAHCLASHGRAAKLSVQTLETSHSPFLSQPELVVNILENIIAECVNILS